MKKTKGGLMSFNNFLSTSRNRQISLENFAWPATKNPDLVGILFVMNIDTDICTKSQTPFAEVSQVSYYKDQEEEILFTTHTIFRIDRIERIDDKHNDRLWQVNLTLAGNQDDDFNKLTLSIREEVHLRARRSGWSQLAFIFLKLGEPAKAEILYNLLRPNATSDTDRADYNHKLGWAYDDMGEYSKALTLYQQALEIQKTALPPNHPDLAQSYNNIGNVYSKMGEYSKALTSHERALEIEKIALSPNHPDLAASYNNIGLVYYNMGEYPKALSSYERALEIQKIALPPNHPDLAMTCNNIGAVYYNMGKYSKALTYYERALETKKIALLPNHPDLAMTCNNIGAVYYNMGEYSKALSSHERSLEIRKIALPPNHPDLAQSYNNIGLVYDKMEMKTYNIFSTPLAPDIDDLPPNYFDISIVPNGAILYPNDVTPYTESSKAEIKRNAKGVLSFDQLVDKKS
ncbi:unnamed protein product [Rotaria sp. Silwood1]|nr:unnamed protein product [Rotaria sp. Silwood1]